MTDKTKKIEIIFNTFSSPISKKPKLLKTQKKLIIKDCLYWRYSDNKLDIIIRTKSQTIRYSSAFIFSIKEL